MLKIVVGKVLPAVVLLFGATNIASALPHARLNAHGRAHIHVMEPASTTPSAPGPCISSEGYGTLNGGPVGGFRSRPA